MKFEIKDKNWKRYNLFWHYINNLRNILSVTCDIDITKFLPYIKSKGYSFILLLCGQYVKLLMLVKNLD